MDGGGRLIEAHGKRRAVADQLCRGPGHAVGEFIQRVQQGGLFPPVLEDAGLVFIKPVEVGQNLGVAGSDLADGVVHEPPPHRRALLDEIQIVRAEEHGVDRVGKLPGGLFGGVHQDTLGPAGGEAEVHGLLPPVAVHIGQDVRPVGAEAHQLFIKPCPEAPAHGEHIDGLQQGGLSLGVFSADDIGAGVKIRRLKGIIAKGAQGNAPDDHAFVTSSVKP